MGPRGGTGLVVDLADSPAASCKSTAGLLLLLAVSLGLNLLTSRASQAGSIYDAAADFEAGWQAGTNPNSVWRYGWSTGLSGPVTLFRRHHLPPVYGGIEHMWDDPNNNRGFTPSVAIATEDYSDGDVMFTKGALILQPGGEGGQDYVHVIFTAPDSGVYHLTDLFSGLQQDISVDVNLVINGFTWSTGHITAMGQGMGNEGSWVLAAGDTVDLAVGPNGDFTPHSVSTGLTATLTFLGAPVPVPEPPSVLLLGAGVVVSSCFVGTSSKLR